MIKLCNRQAHLDGGLDALEAVGRNGVHRWTLNKLEVAECGKVEAEVLQCVGSLVDEEDV